MDTQYGEYNNNGNGVSLTESSDKRRVGRKRRTGNSIYVLDIVLHII